MKVKPIPYYGGKQRLARRIVDLLPPHTVYVEPFVGGGAVLCAKGVPADCNSSDQYREVINDHDESLIGLWRSLRDDPALCRKLQTTLYSRAEHVAAKKCRRTDPWGKYVSLAMSFSNVEGGGLRTGVFGRNPAATWASSIDALPLLAARLSCVHIECDDAIAVINRWDSPQTCFYCDPPYPGCAQGHYSGYTQQDFDALCNALSGCAGSFVLSCYRNESADALGATRVDVAASATSSMKGKAGKGRDKTRAATAAELGNRDRTECLWIVDRSANTRPELRNVLWSPSKGYAYREQLPLGL